MAPPRRPKPLAPTDRDLWRKVTETVTPLKARAGGRRTPETPEVSPPKALPDALPDALADGRPPEPAAAARPAKPPRAAARTSKPQTPTVPPLNPLDKRLTRRIGRGARAVDAKIDLHGLTQQEAHDRLLAFLRGARARGHRLVLVVTGKGRPAAQADWWTEGTRGVLRRAVPEWLATPPFRLLVVGYEQAHLRKGGEGAIYVQLRRGERRDTARETGG